MDYKSPAEMISSPLQQARVAQAAIKLALDIMAEVQSTPGHDNRSQFAEAVLRSPETYGALMLRGVVTNPNCGTGVSDPLEDDGALEFVVSSLWNAYAGFSYGPAQGAPAQTSHKSFLSKIIW